jgi:hypothetical protein
MAVKRLIIELIIIVEFLKKIHHLNYPTCNVCKGRKVVQKCNFYTSRGTLQLIHTYHSRFIPEGVTEAFQISLRDAHVLPKLFSYE